MATLLQDAAGDWWTALLKERHGSRPADYTEMSALLRKRFGSSTRVDRARAALRNIKQSTNENVRAYSTRFESLLSKLPSFDAEWAKSQYIWGLNQRVAELVVIAEPADLHAAILKAEKIEMARSTVSGNQGQTSGGWPRISRGRFSRGRGRFAAVQQTSGHGAQQTIAVQNQSGQPGPRLNLNNVQCYRCKGWGHMSSHCPSDRSVQYRGGRSGGRSRGRSSKRPRKRRTRTRPYTSQLTPPWSRPDQERLHRRHRCRTLPQCPRPLGRETSCAPLWPAMSAGGEVGTPCPP